MTTHDDAEWLRGLADEWFGDRSKPSRSIGPTLRAIAARIDAALGVPEPVVIAEFPAHRALAELADEAFVRRCRELNEAVERFARGGKP